MGSVSTSASPVNTRFTWERAVAESDLPSSARLVAFIIAMHHGPLGEEVWPSQARIARLSGLGLRSVNRHVAELEAAGFIIQTHRQGTSSKYRMVTPGVRQSGVDLSTGGVSPTPQRRTEQTIEQTKEHRPLHQEIMTSFAEWIGRNPSGGEGGRWGRVAKLMAADGVTGADVTARAANYDTYGWDRSPQGLWNHWGLMETPKPGTTTDGTDPHVAALLELRAYAEQRGLS